MSESRRVGGKRGPRGAPAASPAAAPGGEHTVPVELAGRPLDGIVRALFGASWGDARKWIGSGKVRVDGQTVLDHERPVRAGVAVVLAMNAPRRSKEGGRSGPPELDDAAIVYVDTHVVVVNKPAGVSTIPFDEKEKGTLDELVRNWLSKRTRRGERGTRPSLGIVHRLDKETSGVIVFTRTWLAKQSLTQQFRVHTVHRRYLAIAHGVVQARTLRSHLLADRGDGLRGSARGRGRGGGGGGGGEAQGQLAITHVEPVEELEGATLVACTLETGRTHQIRVHLSEAGHPVVGERVYIRGFRGEVIPAPRLMLHAAELGFVHPATNAEVRFEREPPGDFEETVGRLRG
ncbi:MAG: RluA family pseudouridine synthase [Polyangiaceae bacterium]